ncbi:MAG: hypothetical protein PVI00_17010, partial [Desulfobacterales bacterium]
LIFHNLQKKHGFSKLNLWVRMLIARFVQPEPGVDGIRWVTRYQEEADENCLKSIPSPAN